VLPFFVELADDANGIAFSLYITADEFHQATTVARYLAIEYSKRLPEGVVNEDPHWKVRACYPAAHTRPSPAQLL
jgi:hypothetical protein